MKEISMIKREVELTGMRDILFDKFKDHSKEKRPPDQKLYLMEGNKLVLPSENFISFLLRESKPTGCIKAFEGKKAGDYLRLAHSCIGITPTYMPFLNGKGKEIVFSEFGKDGFYLFEAAGVTKLSGGGVIKQEVNPRPALSMPWKLRFTLTLVKNPIIDEVKLQNWIENGGIMVGLGNYRPRFGQFVVSKWE
jgi:hypothetical protein